MQISLRMSSRVDEQDVSQLAIGFKHNHHESKVQIVTSVQVGACL